MTNNISFERHYCTSCGIKQYSKNMKFVYYKLLKKSFWHCNKCLSTITDNMHFSNDQKERYFLELFLGSKTVSTVAETQFNYRVFDVDFEEKFTPALCADIAKLRLNQIPNYKKVSVLWASVPCQVYSIMSGLQHWDKITYNHRQYYYIPKTAEARSAVQLLEKTIWLIRSINPVYYFIENPRGALRHMPQINFAPFRYTVSYSDFETDLYKPTDIFSNCGFLNLPKIQTAVGRKFTGSVKEMKNAFDRSIVPPGLVSEILNQIDRRFISTQL